MTFKFRSWILVVIGMVVQFFAGLIFYLAIKETYAADMGQAIALMTFAALSITAMFSPIIAVIPLLLLIPRKTLKVGGILSILFAILCFVIRVAIPLGIFLLIAGILALWKKI